MKPTPELIYEYRERRERAERQAESRRREVYGKLPRLEEIAAERRQAAFEAGLASLKGEDAEPLLQRVTELNREEAELLKKADLPADYLLPRYRCAECRDTGYTGDTVKRLCPCMKARILEQKYASSGIDPEESFALFRTDIYPSEGQRRASVAAMRFCQKFAEEFPKQEPRGLLLIGGTGLGKSYLLNAIALEVSQKGFEVYKTSAYNLINSYMESFRTRTEQPDVISPDMVIIDDLGTEPMINTVTRETLFSLLNERQTAKKATLWATNRDFSDIIAAYGERFFSRLASPRETATLRLEGADLRLRLK